MPRGVSCRFIVGLYVAPEYQGQGIGSALMRYGTEKADQDAVFCWVSSSDSGTKAYEANGFQTVETFTVDLDKYAKKDGIRIGPKEGDKWGEYTWRFMVRQPR